MPKKVDRVRLDFVVPVEFKRKLEELSFVEHKKMTSIICRLIEQEYKSRMSELDAPEDKLSQLEVRLSDLELRYNVLESSLIEDGSYMPF